MHPLTKHAEAAMPLHTMMLDPAAEEQRWPEGLPLTKENVANVMRTHDIHVESSVYAGADPDEWDWRPTNSGPSKNRKQGYRGRQDPEKAIFTSRDVSRWHPYCRRALTLYEMYLFGADYYMSINPLRLPTSLDEFDEHYEMMLRAEKVWTNLLAANRNSFSPQETVRRTYRDGECFIRVRRNVWPWRIEFIDPEEIADPSGDENGNKGIVTAPNDVYTVLEYLRVDTSTKKLIERIPASEMYHIKIDADTNELRGKTRFLSCLVIARLLEGFTFTETTHRQMQASIVLRRKVEGGGAVAQMVLNNTRTKQLADGTSTDRIQPGQTITEPRGVTTEFVQPKSDFTNANPLAAFLLRHIAAATGWPYSMISQDSSQGNLASEQLTEGPTKTMIQHERQVFDHVFRDLFMGVISAAASKNEMSSKYRGPNIWETYSPLFNYGSEADREPLKTAQAGNLSYMSNSASAQDLCERAGRNWIRTVARILSERALGIFPPSYQMPSGSDRAQSSADNATDGSGTNQSGQQ